MKLTQITFSNFRQYIDEHTVKFAGVDDSRNVTLIRGANGYGKTGIFRAVMYCLYGDKFLAQDDLSPIAKKRGLTIVNERLVNESLGKPVNAWVEACFTHDGEEFTLRRDIQASLIEASGEIVQQDGAVRLQVLKRTGDTEPPVTDVDKINAAVNQILPSKLKDFFLFDGERMNTLTQPGEQQKKEVQRGIRTLLQLDILEQSIEALKKQEQILSKHIQANSNSDLEAVMEKKLNLDSELSSLESDLVQANNNIELVEGELQQLDNQLEQHKETFELQEERKQLQGEILSKQSVRDEKAKALRLVLAEMAPTMLLPQIAELFAELTGRFERGELPENVKQEFLEALLENELCICGTHLVEGSAERERIIAFKMRESKPGQTDLIMLNSRLGLIQQFATDKERDFEQILVSINSVKEEIESLEKRFARKEEELEGCGNVDVEKLMSSLQQFRKEKEAYVKKIALLENKISEKTEARNKLDQKIEELSAKNKVAQTYNNQRAAILRAIASLKRVSNRYTTVVKDKLAELATAAFKGMASAETLESLTKIVITDDFHLEVENSLQRPMLSQISSGQRQIVSLAYICALIESCGNLEMPLFMDTPFGRLSGAMRDGCLHFLPSKTSQWILLGSDTEIQQDEADALRGSGKFGRVYEIEAVRSLQSNIKEENVNSWVPIRTKAKIGVAPV